MHILLLYSYYAHFIIEKTLKFELEEGQMSLWLASVSPHTSSLLPSLMVRMLLSWYWLSLLQVQSVDSTYLLPCDNLCMHLAIIPAQCSNAFGLQLLPHYAPTLWHVPLLPMRPEDRLERCDTDIEGYSAHYTFNTKGILAIMCLASSVRITPGWSTLMVTLLPWSIFARARVNKMFASLLCW